MYHGQFTKVWESGGTRSIALIGGVVERLTEKGEIIARGSIRGPEKGVLAYVGRPRNSERELRNHGETL